MPEKSPISPFVKVLAAFFALLGICLLIGIAVFLFNLYQNDKEKEEMVDRNICCCIIRKKKLQILKRFP